jgi:hypothetical protein
MQMTATAGSTTRLQAKPGMFQFVQRLPKKRTDTDCQPKGNSQAWISQ